MTEMTDLAKGVVVLIGIGVFIACIMACYLYR